jgi:hypothetical protein
MGWQDAPVVDTQPAWMSAPEVDAPKAKPETGFAETLGRGVANIGAGALRGAGSIGATLIRPFESAQANAERRKAMDDALASLGAEPDSWAYAGGKLGGEIAGTAGAGGVLANGVRFAPALANALRTGGFTTGAAPANALARAGDMGLRVAGGGVSGAAAAGLVDPNDALVGGAIGAALPPALKAAGAAGAPIGRGIANLRKSKEQQAAEVIAQKMGATTPAEIEALRARLNPQGPNLIPGDQATVPQLAQNMDISQLARSIHNAGGTQIAEREALNNEARLAALNRISPVGSTLQQSAEDFGNAIEGFARPAEKAARRNVSDLYESVDPFGETKVLPPLSEMQAARAKYLGAGTFGSGKAADQAIAQAEAMSPEMALPAVKTQRSRKPQSLLEAVKAAGGINEARTSALGGEVSGLRQAGIGRAVYKNKGLSLEKMAEKMHEAGYLPNEDPDTLINLLPDGGTIYAGGAESIYRKAADEAYGGAPAAEMLRTPVPFQAIQNLRSSIGEEAFKARVAGNAREAAALNQMKADIDARVSAVASGEGRVGENFPTDSIEAWKAANKAHADKKLRFDTGPQRSMFRTGSDGQPVSQGAELAGKFVNGGRSQVEDANALRRLNGDNGPLLAAAKNYLMTDAAGQTNALGTLSNAKFNNWRDKRSGSLRELLDSGENALMQGIGQNLSRADSANRLGMATGSNTAQNLSNALSNGLLDSPITNALAQRIPGVRMLTGPGLKALQEAARSAKAQTFGELLADPVALDRALATVPQSETELRRVLMSARAALGQAAYRSAPVALQQ